MFRKSYGYAALLIVLMSFPYSILPPAHAQSYTAGVKVGDTVVFGKVAVSVQGGGPLPLGLDQINQTLSLTIKITGVDVTNRIVTGDLTFLYRNLTSQTRTFTTNVQDGSGDLGFVLLSGGLSAGDQFYQQSSFSPFGVFGLSFIPETLARPYAGAVRTVNALSLTEPQQSGTSISFSWDQATGFLLELSETIPGSSPSQTVSVHIKATETNIWQSSSSPDFSLDASSALPVNHLGETNNYSLNLTSINNFKDTIGLTLTLLNSTVTTPPAIALAQNSLTVTPAGSSTTTLTFSTGASTLRGLYLFTLTARGTTTSPSHTAIFAVEAVPPDFEVLATPPNVTVTAGSATTSQITVRALGLFTGIVTISSFSYTPVLQLSLDKTSLTLSSTVTSANSILTISASPYAIPGQSAVFVQGRSPSAPPSNINSLFSRHSAQILVSITGPDFELVPSSSQINIPPGGTGTSSITLTSLDGFAGTVGLAASSYGGLGVALKPATLSLSPGSSAASTATVSVAPDTPNGFYQFTLTGVSRLLTHSAYMTVSVTGPDFTISASPSTFPLKPGQTVNASITLTSLNGFSGSVTLAATVIGSPLGFIFSSTSVTLTAAGSATSTLKISIPSSIDPQSYATIQIYASSGILSHAYYLNTALQVVRSSGPDFYPVLDPYSLTLTRGASANSTLTVLSQNGFHGSVSISTFLGGQSFPQICPNPTCPTASVAPSVLSVPAGGSNSSTLTVSANSSTLLGYYFVIVTVTNGTVSRGASLSVYVAGPDFQLFSNQPYLTILKGGSAVPTILVTSSLGFSGSINLTASVSTGFFGSCLVNCPATFLSPAKVTLIPSGTTASKLTITTSATTTPGTYYISVTGTNGTARHETILSVAVQGEDFTLLTSPSPMILSQGGSGSLLILVSSLNGFSGKVTVNLSPNGGSLLLPLSPVTLKVPAGGSNSTRITIATLPTTNPGGYSFNVNGQNATLSHSSYVQVIVAGPDFGIFTRNGFPQINVQVGGTNSSIVILSSLDGFSGTVGLNGTIQFGPLGSCLANCPTISLRESLTLQPGDSNSTRFTITVPSNAIPGTYFANLNAKSGTIFHSAFVLINVTTPQPPDFTITASSNSFQARIGRSVNVTLTLTGMFGFTDNVHLSVKSISIAGPTATITPSNIYLTPTTTGTATLTVSMPHGIHKDTSFTITIEAQSSTSTHTITLTVTAIHHIPR